MDLETASFYEIIQQIVEEKTGNAHVYRKLSSFNIEEAVNSLDWIVFITQDILTGYK